MLIARNITRLLRSPLYPARISPSLIRHSSTSDHNTPSPVVDTFSTTNAPTPGPSALQKHAMFFDRDLDGKITLAETFQSLSLLGFGKTRSSALALAINGGLGRIIGAPWYAPFTITIAEIHKGKHPSDTDIYGTDGQFNPEKFNELFSQYDTNGDDALSSEEFETFFTRKFEDKGSSLTSKFEFGLLLEIAGEDRVIGGAPTRVLTRETLSKFYDGTLLFNIVGESVPF